MADKRILDSFAFWWLITSFSSRKPMNIEHSMSRILWSGPTVRAVKTIAARK